MAGDLEQGPLRGRVGAADEHHEDRSGARLPRHRHTGLEQSFILQGSLVDEDGACTAGNFVWRRPGSVHGAWSPDGCLVIGIFESPNEFLEG